MFIMPPSFGGNRFINVGLINMPAGFFNMGPPPGTHEMVKTSCLDPGQILM